MTVLRAILLPSGDASGWPLDGGEASGARDVRARACLGTDCHTLSARA